MTTNPLTELVERLNGYFVDLPPIIVLRIEQELGTTQSFSVHPKVRGAIGENVWNAIEPLRKEAAEAITLLQSLLEEARVAMEEVIAALDNPHIDQRSVIERVAEEALRSLQGVRDGAGEAGDG